jgi:hypothetical protein
VTTVKVLCDTDTLIHNIRHEHEKTEKERAALKKLLEMRAAGRLQMFRSQVNLVEVTNTKNDNQRDKLLADYMALDPVSKEENISGQQCIPGPTGSFISNPVSDLDSPVYKACRSQGLKERDTLHILRAVENGYDVFLTRDEDTIIRPHRRWLAKTFPCLKVRLPSELVAELQTDLP